MARNPAIRFGASFATRRLSERSHPRNLSVARPEGPQAAPGIGGERVSLARIVRPHGLRGEVAAEILTGFPQRLISLKRVWLWNGAERLREAEVRSCRLTSSRGGQALFQFSHCNSIEDAQALVGCQVQIPLSERLPLADGQYYITDLEGCTVREEGRPELGHDEAQMLGRTLGEVTYVQETGEKATGTPVLVVRSEEKEFLIPLAAEICIHIDPAAREIVVRLPPGLRELNDPKLPVMEDPGGS